MQEDSEIELMTFEIWTMDCGDMGKFELTAKEVDVVMMAESKKSRFIRFPPPIGIVNIAFIRGIKPKVLRGDYKYFDQRPEPMPDKRFLVEGRLQLSS